jgi:hypothetical protein
MDDAINFENVTELFSTGIPPEISHFRNQKHPGRNWWLKTVIPVEETTTPSKVWQMVLKKEPFNVMITDIAYDWKGTVIVGARSVWIRQGIDVVINIDDNKVGYKTKKFAESFNDSGKWLYEQITRSWESNVQNINDEDWHNLFSVAELMSAWTTEDQATEKRKVFKVIKNEKNNSQADQSSKLDSK